MGTAAGWDPEVGDSKGGERQVEGKGTMDENENTVVCRMNLVGIIEAHDYKRTLPDANSISCMTGVRLPGE